MLVFRPDVHKIDFMSKNKAKEITAPQEILIHCKYDELIDPKKLKNHPKNRNKHGQDQIDRLAEMYKYHGLRHPIIVSKISGHIVAGHGRKLAAIRAGVKEVPVVYQDFKDGEAEYAFLQADNAIALWAELDLSGINEDLADLGPDFDINMLGIQDFTLDVAEKEGLTDEDEVPEAPPEPVSKLGDLWLLGNHRLLCGDSTSEADVARLMNGEKADITFTSPPYNAGKTPNGNSQKYLNDSDNKTSEDYKNLLNNFTKNCLLFSDYVFSNIQSLSGNKIALIEHLYELKEKFADTIIWDKKTAEPAMARKVLNSRFEYIHIFSNEAKRSIGKKDFRGTLSNVFELNSRQGKEFAKIHKATFPVQLPVHFLENFTESSVLEPFGGTGTTLIACEKTNRKCFIQELDPQYVDVIIKRWEQFTGQKARHESGKSFEEIKNDRQQ